MRVKRDYRFVQRASAACLALSDRSLAVIALALALPPFNPPLRPSATAAGSLPASGSTRSICPVASATRVAASWLKSLGLRKRFGIC